MMHISKMTMASQYLEAQIKTLHTFGFASEVSLDILNLPKTTLNNKYARFEVNSLIPLYEGAAEALNDPDISLRTGYQFRVATFQKTGNIYTVCDNIRQVVQMNSCYQRIAIYAGNVSLLSDEANTRSFLDFEPYYSDLDDARHITNLIFGAYGAAFRWLNWGTGKGLKAVYLRQAEPLDLALFQNVFDCPVTFNAPSDRLEFFTEHLDTPFPTRNPVKRAQFESQLDYVLQRENNTESFLKAVHLTLQDHLNNGCVNFLSLANAMGMTEKQSRLAFKRADTNFREQLDRARIERFKTLAAQQESFVSIAQHLCYNDQAAFSRAFKRWYGVAPGDWHAGLSIKRQSTEEQT